MTANPPKKSDLGVRVLSAIVMVAVAGMALWLGGWAWTLFVVAVGLGVLWEWTRLAFAFEKGPAGQAMWLLAGLVYVGFGASALADAFDTGIDSASVLAIISVVAAVDVGAYFSGRTFGGPKIAPLISPSKTWSGLAGGAVAASLVICIEEFLFGAFRSNFIPGYAIFGLLITVVAQAGDFFESWMKRRADVKDSGTLIPGHGGLFDRLDGLLAVVFVLGIISAYLALQAPRFHPPVIY